MSENYSFVDDWKQSLKDADLPLWERIYRRIFGDDFVSMRIEQGDLEQRRGIDRVVTTRGEIEHFFEEKLRRNWSWNYSFNDVATELYSDFERRVVGWPYRPLSCESFNYVRLTPQTDKALVWNYADLHAVGLRYKAEWVRKVWGDGQVRLEAKKGLDGFVSLLSANGTHTTLGLCVPEKVICAAVKPWFELHGFSSDAERERWLKKEVYDGRSCCVCGKPDSPFGYKPPAIESGQKWYCFEHWPDKLERALDGLTLTLEPVAFARRVKQAEEAMNARRPSAGGDLPSDGGR